MVSTGLLCAASPVVRDSSLPCCVRTIADSEEIWRCQNQKVFSWKISSKDTMRSIKNCSENCTIPGEDPTSQRVTRGVFRREVVLLPATLFALSVRTLWKEERAVASDYVDMPALRGKDYGKPKMRYPDYTLTESGLQFKDLRLGTGATPKEGETVVVDWDGYTIGYYGRIFEARNKAKGGSFEGNEKNYLRFRLGTHEVIPAFEEAIMTMNLGGVRRIVVPPELGYLDNDINKKGPKPTTFSGQRALLFVLQNQNLIDKTLLFDIELLKISPT